LEIVGCALQTERYDLERPQTPPSWGRFFRYWVIPGQTVGKMLQSPEPGARRRVESPLPADAPKAPWPGENLPTGWRPQRYAWGRF